jgi:hypothetical protein
MRIAKTLDDLPIGTPVVVESLGGSKGLVCYRGWLEYTGFEPREEYIKILFANGQEVVYYEEGLEKEEIMIVEIR